MKGFTDWAYNASWFTLGIAFASILLFGVVAVQAATTISANISTGGTLAVTGASTLTGLATAEGGFISQASSTVTGGAFTVTGNTSLQQASSTNQTLSGNLWVNGNATTTSAGAISTQSTLGVTGLSTLTGGFVSQASSTVTGGAFTVTGNTSLQQASSTNQTLSGNLWVNGNATTTSAGAISTQSTLGVTGLSTLTGGFVSQASSTVSTGQLTVVGAVVGSSTLQVTGATRVYGGLTNSSSGTSTLTLSSTAATQGFCIQAAATSSATPVYFVATTTGQGTGFGGVMLVGNFGTCP